MNILDIAIAKKLAGGGGGSGTDNYNDLSNLPKINDTTLSGNKTSANLGLQSEINSDSKLASDLVDDTNQDNKFVTSSEKSTWNGKQNAIDADHKINADYVDDSTSTNKFVTATDKETWNAKQNAIDSSHKLSSDLVDDTNHTNKFVTSTEKQTWNGKQNAIDSDHKLSSSLVSFTTAEAAALASGIDSTKVGQISTNQTNILSAESMVCDNAFSTSTAYAEGDIVTYNHKLYKFKTAHSAGAWNSSQVDQISTTGLITPELIELVDSGAKNLVDCSVDNIKALNSTSSYSWNGNTVTAEGRTATVNADKTITVAAGTGTDEFWLKVANYAYASGVSYVLSGCPTNGSTTTYYMESDNLNLRDIGSGVVINSATTDALYIVVKTTGATPELTFKPMLCTLAAWNVSHKYVQYRPNWDLVVSEINTIKSNEGILVDSTTTIGTDWTLTNITLQAPVNAYVLMNAFIHWGQKAPRGIRITRTNTSATEAVLATVEDTNDKYQLGITALGIKSGGANTYYVWAKAKEASTNIPVQLTYKYY